MEIYIILGIITFNICCSYFLIKKKIKQRFINSKVYSINEEKILTRERSNAVTKTINTPSLGRTVSEKPTRQTIDKSMNNIYSEKIQKNKNETKSLDSGQSNNSSSIKNLDRDSIDKYQIHRKKMGIYLSSGYNSSVDSIPEDLQNYNHELFYSKKIIRKNKCVCTEKILENELIQRLPCGHYFHDRCIIDWIKKEKIFICPICCYNLQIID